MILTSFASILQDKLLASGDPAHAPSQLAELFRWTFYSSKNSLIVRNILQKNLLNWTIQKAYEHTRFYHQEIYLESISTAPGDPPNLDCWPVIRRADVINNLRDIRNENLTFSASCQTTGCTGPALSVYKSAEELSFMWDYQKQLMQPVRKKLKSRPLVLSMPNLYHGNPIRVPSIGTPFVVGVTDDLLLDNAIKLLRKRFEIPEHDQHFSIITCLVHQMLFFTNYLQENDIDPREFGIKSINIVGGYLTTRCRRYLQTTWGAIVFDRFSLTESAGGATRCQKCGYFHLDPHVIGEVLESETNNQLTEGVGHLVLTELYPFVQMQPFIRYDTGDLVRRVKNDCHPALTFEFVGKSSNCVSWHINGYKEWLIFSVALLEILDVIPDFRRVEQFRGVHTAKDASVGSLPIYIINKEISESGILKIALIIELRYAPQFYPERTTELNDTIKAGVYEAHPVLKKRVAQGEIDFQVIFVSPGTLGDTNLLKI